MVNRLTRSNPHGCVVGIFISKVFGVMNVALDKAIKYGKEHRKPYGKGYGNYAKSVDRSCRNHGGCSWCEGNRTYKYRKRAAGMIAAMNEKL